MQGFLKAAGTIQQCTRCYALRDLTTEEVECASCRKLLNIRHTETRTLVLCDAEHDTAPMPQGTIYLVDAKAATA